MARFGQRLVTRARREYAERRFAHAARGVLNTPPLCPRPGPVILSQICHRDVIAYLVAVKSLHHAIGGGSVVVIDDGSLRAKDCDLLSSHIPGVEVIPISSINTGVCPRGGTWERLIKIIELTHDNYVIQMDADTISSGPIPEVIECWKANKSFLLGTDVGRSVEPATYTAELARCWAESMSRISIGTMAEAALDQLQETRSRYYVHASSGFAGFARGSFRLCDLYELSLAMRGRFGERWMEWGSEQIASNYLLANSPDPVVLPLERFACFEPHLPRGDRPLYHFIGRYRFDEGLYRRLTSVFLRNIQATG